MPLGSVPPPGAVYVAVSGLVSRSKVPSEAPPGAKSLIVMSSAATTAAAAIAMVLVLLSVSANGMAWLHCVGV